MKIAVVSPYALNVPGGVQHQVVELAARLRDNGHDAFAVAPGAGDVAGAVDIGSSVRARANGSVAPIALWPGAYRRALRATAAADVVHVHEPFMPLVGWAGMRAKTPSVLTFHADPSRFMRLIYRAGAPVLRRAMTRAGAVSAVSAIAHSAIAPLDHSVERIPNALDVGSYRLNPERLPLQVAFLGRPDRRKGRDVLLSAWPAVRKRMPEATLIVMGGGDTPNIEGVRFAGRVDEEDKRQILATSAVFCAPNRGGESFGITVAEGMAAGCAVVASDLPAFIDVLDGTGTLFENGNVRALSAALCDVLSDPESRHRLALASSARVEDFDWATVVSRYIDLYRRALNAG